MAIMPPGTKKPRRLQRVSKSKIPVARAAISTALWVYLGETLNIGDEITVTVLAVKGNQVRIGVNAPKNIEVHRAGGGAAN